MSKRLAVFAAFAVAVVAMLAAGSALAGNGNGKGQGNGLLSPDQAQAMLSASGTSTPLAIRSVPLAEVQAAAAKPGSVTVGSVPVVAPAMSASIMAVQWGCASVVGSWGWGLQPYRVNIDSTVYWCAYYGQQVTSVTVTPNPWTQWFCNVDGSNGYTVSGGVGYSWATERAAASFTCPTIIPWISAHANHWFDINVNAWGNSSYGSNG